MAGACHVIRQAKPPAPPRSGGLLLVEIGVLGEVEAGFFGQQSVVEAVAAGGFEGDFDARINELPFLRGWLWFVGQAFHLLGFEEADGIIDFGFAEGAALGLEFAELAESLLLRTVPWRSAFMMERAVPSRVRPGVGLGVSLFPGWFSALSRLAAYSAGVGMVVGVLRTEL
jgi:hypothetical protein